MIRLQNVTKTYVSAEVKTEALRGIDLTIDRGEYVAIMGASGSGKSTLLNIIGGMDQLTEGEYQFEDIKVHALSVKQLHKFRRDHVAFVFQNFALVNQYTVYENMEFPLIARGVSHVKRKAAVQEALKSFQIEELAKKYPSQISGGQQQRVAIARALVTDVELLLADEPTGALDQKTGAEVMKLLDEIHEQGKTVIVITHDPMVAKHANRMVYLQDGKIVAPEMSQ